MTVRNHLMSAKKIRNAYISMVTKILNYDAFLTNARYI